MWIEALRSGEYTQGRDYLSRRTPAGTYLFGPLGVACELYTLVHPGSIKVTEVDDVQRYDGYYTTLPPLVQQWLGLATDRADYIDSNGHQRNLTSDNDIRHLSFEEIAQIIEDHQRIIYDNDHFVGVPKERQIYIAKRVAELEE